MRIRERERRVLQLVVVGRTQHQIAAEVGVSQPAVSKILKRVEERLLAELAPMVDRWRVRQTLRLDHLYAESVTAWEASKQDAMRRRQRKADGPGGGTVAELVSENRHGDPRFLELARKTLADLRELWAINPPDRVAIAGSFATLSDAQLEAELARQEEVFRRLDLTVGDRVIVSGAPHQAPPNGGTDA